MTFRYTPEQLLHLKQSPLVQKPDGLPSIDQWMEGQKQAKEDPTRRKTHATPRDEHDNTLARLAGNARRPRQSEGDSVLGPPKMNFTSNSRNQIRTDPVDRRTPRSFNDNATTKDGSDFQDGFFRPQADFSQPRDRQNGTRRQRETEGSRWDRLEDRGDRERKPRDIDGAEAHVRRNGAGRGRTDGEWSRVEPQASTGDTSRDVRSFSWRDGNREAPREREAREGDYYNKDRDRGRRDWTRQNRYDAQEEEPEWMNDAPEVEEKEAKTQDDFQKWKDQQKRILAGNSDMPEVDPQLSSPATRSTAVSSKSTGLQPTLGNAFGTFQAAQTDRDNTSEAPTTNKKASRFEGLFKKEEIPASLPFLGAQHESAFKPPAGGELKSEDQEGFQRILMMLGNKGLTPKPVDSAGPEQPAAANSHRERGIHPKSTPDYKRDSTGFINDILARQMASQERTEGRGLDQMSKDFERFEMRSQPHDEGRQPPDAPNNGLGSRFGVQRHASDADERISPAPALDQNKAFLLNLMNNRMTEPQRPADAPDNGFFSQAGPATARYAPSAPPGLDPQRRPLPSQDTPGNRRGPQAPPGFFDQDAAPPSMTMPPPGLARRNTAESGMPPGAMGRQLPSQASNLGIPSMRMNEGMMMRNGGQMGLDGRMLSGPPPGLLPNQAPPGHQQHHPGLAPNHNGPGLPNGMRPNIPPMGLPGFPPQGIPLNMHNMPHGPGHFPMGLPHPQQHPAPPFGNGPPPPGMFPMTGPGGQAGFFPPGGRGFPPGFEGDLRGAPHGRGFQGQ